MDPERASMELTVLGSGSAMPVPDRVQAGYLLDDGDRSLLVDCGSGVLQRLAATETGYEGVSTVLLTHHHLDHVSALLPLMKARWLAGEEHLEVLGPTGTKSLLDGLLDVYEYLDGRIDLAVRGIDVGARRREPVGEPLHRVARLAGGHVEPGRREGPRRRHLADR